MQKVCQNRNVLIMHLLCILYEGKSKSSDDITRVEGGVYEDGTADEQAVSEATFYFFDAAGNAFNINANGNYYNVAVADNGGTEAPNIESMTDPVIVVEKHAES